MSGLVRVFQIAHHHDGYAALSDGFAQARYFEAFSIGASCLHLRIELIVGHDIPMLKAACDAAVELHLKRKYLAQRFKLGACGVKHCSTWSFVLMLWSGYACLLFVVLLIGLTEKGTSPGGCRVAADSAS